MRFIELCDKDVVNANDCRYIGHIRDIEFDCECGKICAIVVPGPGRYWGCICRDYEYFIPWVKIIRIGPDIVLVDLDEQCMKHKI